MLKFGVKTAVVGAAVYYTVDAGVWSDSATTSVLYDDVQKKISPYVGEVKKQIPYELPPLPGSEKISYLGKYYWNCGVKTTFRFLVNLPTHASEAAIKSFNYISSAINTEEQTAPIAETVKK